MKNTIFYAVIFLLAFVGTTVAIYTMNNKYVNMFEFDFRESAVVEAAIADSVARGRSPVVLPAMGNLSQDVTFVSELLVDQAS